MPHNTMDQQFEGFDFARDVIGDDLIVDGVVYDSSIWTVDGEGGVMRRCEEARDLEATSQDIATEEILRRAAAIASDYAALARNISTGPDLAELLRRHRELLCDAETWDVQPSRIENIIDAALANA
ncbi:hypothetical protein [Rhodococcus sp. RDE2]|uniref:hypothetical protein n=1 Tax=Rhodococcus sp. RDE2 TaxID=2885078 RepID=UPI001E5DE688|nr:hypothetical protein [Rhodococcus sp. RDE2]BDB63542.1 hypothetical protein RDE2_53360 [Rhodococcus sp. RDE2]